MVDKKGVKDKRVIVETLFWSGLAIVVLSFLYDQVFIITIPIGLACMILAGLENLLSKASITKKISRFEEISKILLFLILNLMVALSLKPRLPSWKKSIIMLFQLPPGKIWWLNAILGLMVGLILLFILTNLYVYFSERKIEKMIKKPKEKIVKAILEKIRNWPKRPKEIRRRITIGKEITKEVIERYKNLIEARIRMKECMRKALKAGYSLEKIKKITKSIGWSEGETRILINEVVRMGRKYIYTIFFLLGLFIVIACLLNIKNYPIIFLIGIAIMAIAVLSYPKIKIKREKIKPIKIKPVKIKPKLVKISIGEKIKSLFRKKPKPPKKEKPKKEKIRLSLKERIKKLLETRRRLKEERKKWKKRERERKKKEREEDKKRLKEERKRKKEEKAKKRKKIIEEFKEGIKLKKLFKKRPKAEKEKKPKKEKIKLKKEDMPLIKAIRESVDRAQKQETHLDTLYKLVEKYGRLRLSTIAIGFNIGKEQAEEWARILEEHKLAKTHYPAIGEPEIRKIEEPKKEEFEESEEEKPEEKFKEIQKEVKKEVPKKAEELKEEIKKPKKETKKLKELRKGLRKKSKKI